MITLAILFLAIIIACAFEVYRSNRAYAKRIERETDEGIIRSKEEAAKIHETPKMALKGVSFNAVPLTEPPPLPYESITNQVALKHLENGITPIYENPSDTEE